MIAPPLCDVVGIAKGPWLVVVRSPVHQREWCHSGEYNEGELRQVDIMDLLEDLLAYPWICCRLFLGVQGIQGTVAVEAEVESTKVIGR